MNFKPLIITISIILLIYILVPNFHNNTKGFETLLGTTENNITKVTITSGHTGNTFSTKNKTQIKELVNLFNNRIYNKSSNQQIKCGYTFSCDFYGKSRKILHTTIGSDTHFIINNIYYDVDKPIEVDKLTLWFKSLKTSENK